LYIENDAEIFPEHYTWKVADKGFKMAVKMNKLAMINFCEIILKNKNNFFAKNHCEIQVRTILVCTLYLIKYGNCDIKVYTLSFILSFRFYYEKCLLLPNCFNKVGHLLFCK
jgi:hypothetical protein